MASNNLTSQIVIVHDQEYLSCLFGAAKLLIILVSYPAEPEVLGSKAKNKKTGGVFMSKMKNPKMCITDLVNIPIGSDVEVIETAYKANWLSFPSAKDLGIECLDCMNYDVCNGHIAIGNVIAEREHFAQQAKKSSKSSG